MSRDHDTEARPAMAGADPARFVIVAALDLSPMSATVIEHALDSASRHHACDLHFISVVPVVAGISQRVLDPEAEMQEAERSLREHLAAPVARFARGAGRARPWQLRMHLRAGDPAEEIVRLARDARAGLLVLGRYGWGGWRGYTVGSVSERVLRLAREPVLLVQPAHRARDDAAVCPACMAVRQERAQDRWFCERHASDWHDRARTVSMTGTTGNLRPGGIF